MSFERSFPAKYLRPFVLAGLGLLLYKVVGYTQPMPTNPPTPPGNSNPFLANPAANGGPANGGGMNGGPMNAAPGNGAGALRTSDQLRVHDPVMAKDGGRYYVFCTGRGISISSSADMAHWERGGKVFDKAPAWTATTIPGSTDYFWAPDISFWNGKWHLYYAVSTFGKNHSAVGLATSPTLDPKRPDYGWKDEGVVIESKEGDNYNAIDPNLFLDSTGQPWLTLGSFWSGLKLVKLDATTGKPADLKAAPIAIAARPNTAIEAPFLIFRNGYYYLFASFDLCCKGVDSTYNIRVGRAKEISGPYLDREGHSMLESGGTLLRESGKRWKGPGHNAVFTENGQDYIVYHAYDAQDNGVSKLRIEPMNWDKEGWPVLPKVEE